MQTRHAMTLVEVLAVVVILGILAATLAVGFSGAFGKGKQELAKTGIGLVVGRLEIYKMEHDAWPDNSIGLAALSDGHADPADAYYMGPDSLLDPWGRPFLFVTPGPEGKPFEVISYGADAQPGGTGENSDVSSANLRAKGDT